jgi:hypothetical protein
MMNDNVVPQPGALPPVQPGPSIPALKLSLSENGGLVNGEVSMEYVAVNDEASMVPPTRLNVRGCDCLS